MAEFTAAKESSRVIAMKAETTAGTDVFSDTYIAADVLNAIQGSIRVTMDPAEIQNRMTAGRLGRAPSMVGKLTAQVSGSMWVRGKFDGTSAYDDSPEVVPEIDRVLRAAGHARTFTTPGGPSAVLTYKPTDTDEVFTVYVVDKIPGGLGMSWQLVGCEAVGCRFTTEAAGGLRMDFTLMGALEERKDITWVGGTLQTIPSPPVTKAAAFQIGSANYAPRIRTLGFDMGLSSQYIDSINAVGGIVGVFRDDRNPRLTIDPEVDREANSSWWSKLSAGGPLNDCTFQCGTVMGNRLKFKFASDGIAAQLQLVAQALDARNGLGALPSTFLPTISVGEDDYALTFD